MAIRRVVRVHDHDHDGGGCLDCRCTAAPSNAWPCTCPVGDRMVSKRMLAGEEVTQEQLRGTIPEGPSFGELTRTKSGNGFIFCLEVAEEYRHLLTEAHLNLVVYPTAGFSLAPPQKKPVTIEDHIILGED